MKEWKEEIANNIVHRLHCSYSGKIYIKDYAREIGINRMTSTEILEVMMAVKKQYEFSVFGCVDIPSNNLYSHWENGFVVKGHEKISGSFEILM